MIIAIRGENKDYGFSIKIFNNSNNDDDYFEISDFENKSSLFVVNQDGKYRVVYESDLFNVIEKYFDEDPRET